MHSSPSYDTRKYDCCAPWFGEVGQEFTRRFRPEFEGALHSFVDSYASLYDHVVLLSDPGAPGVPHQPPGAAAAAVAARAASAQAYAIRQKKSFALIRKHIEDQAIRDDLDAPAIVGQGTLAWPIVIMAGTAQQTLLNLTDQDDEWNATSFADVGIDERTFPNFHALLNRLNRERPPANRKSNVEIFQRIMLSLKSFGHNDLKSKATDELQTPRFMHAAGALAGQPNVPITVQSYAERWRSAIADGSIRRQPPRKRTPPTGNRVDAMMIPTLMTNTTADQPFVIPTEGGGPAQLYAFQSGQRLTPAVLERICFNCRGLGHTFKDSTSTIVCPSEVKTRSYATAIAALEETKRRDGGRGNRRIRLTRRARPPGQQPPSSARLAAEEQVLELEVDDQDRVYTTDGLLIGTLDGHTVVPVTMASDQSDQPVPVELAQPPDNQIVESGSLVTVDAAAASTLAPPSETAAIPPETPAKIETTNEVTRQYTMDDDFEDAFVSFNMADTVPSPPTWKHASTAVLAAAAIGTVAVLAAGAARTSGRAGKLLLMLGLATAHSVSNMNASNYDTTGFETVDLRILPANASPRPTFSSSNAFNPQSGGAMDTGASKHASGRAKLFPKRHVQQYNPKIVVEIANSTRCHVALLGSMLVPVTSRSNITTSTKKRRHLLLADGILVPALKDNTLISPKAMFHNEGIRTYFNDALFCRAPDGTIFDFVETDRLYIWPFHDDHVVTASSLFLASPRHDVPLTLDDLHSRFMYFSVDGIARSRHVLSGIDFSRLPLTGPERERFDSNIHHAVSRRRAHLRTGVHYTRFAQCIASDTVDMEEYSVPFGFRYFLTYLDMATRYLFVYFLRTHTHAEVRLAHLQFLADAKPYMSKGYVELWFIDNGTEFNVSAGVGKHKPGFFANSTDAWLAEYFTHRRFIVPWNPQQNPAESANRVLLRPVRAVFAQTSATTRLWPFAVHQGAIIHNALATTSRNAIHVLTASTTAGPADQPSPAGPLSPYSMLTGKRFNAKWLRPLFCSCEVVIRNTSDLAALTKAEPRTTVLQSTSASTIDALVSSYTSYDTIALQRRHTTIRISQPLQPIRRSPTSSVTSPKRTPPTVYPPSSNRQTPVPKPSQPPSPPLHSMMTTTIAMPISPPATLEPLWPAVVLLSLALRRTSWTDTSTLVSLRIATPRIISCSRPTFGDQWQHPPLPLRPWSKTMTAG